MEQSMIHVSGVPAKLSVNFEEIEARLEKELEKYRIVVTADTVTDARKVMAEMNKIAKEIDTRRKEEVAKVSAPIKQFDEQMKQLVGMCKDGRQAIADQVARFEDETRERVRELLIELRDELWEQAAVREEFRKAVIDELVIVSNLTPTGNLTAKARIAVKDMVSRDREQQQRVDRRLLELENASYRAGLKAPLTRDHVAPFLLWDDEEAYNAELERIIQAELSRQEAAEARMREEIEREHRFREEQERREAERKQAAEQVETRQSSAPAPPPHEPPIPAVPRQGPPAPGADKGMVEWVVRATFKTEVPSHICAADLERELRRKLVEKAGLKKLDSVTAIPAAELDETA